MKWKKCLLSDFFDIKTTKSVDKNKIELKDEAPYDFIGRTSIGWGVQGAVDRLDFAPNPKDSFSLVQVGETVALWREKEWYASQNLFLLQPKLQKIKDVFLYFQTVINKEMSLYGKDYNSYPTMKSLNETHISLPVKIKYIPDFSLMSEIIGGISMSNIDTSSWKEFRLDELFSAESGDFDIKKEHINGLGVDVVTAGETENGILGKSDIMAKVFDGNTITIDMFGKCTYRPDCYKMVTHARVFSLKCLFDDFDEKSGLYITTMLQKLVNGFSYSNMCSWNKIKDLSIKLPVKEVEEIDWDYMQERITELEQERITELEQYLIATGLNDYELTDEDKEILATKLTGGGVLQNSISGNGCLKEARMFRVGDLFEGQTGDVDLQQKDVNGKGTYFINSGVDNNGIKGKTDKPAKIFSANTISIDFWGNAYYRDFQYKMATHNHVFSLSGDCLKNKKVGLYLVAQMSYMKNLYSYSNMGTWNKIKELFVLLPIQTDDNNTPVIDQNHTYHPDGYIPDWTYMEKYIRAIEKVVIKDVVDYKDSIIAKTKEIVA